MEGWMHGGFTPSQHYSPKKTLVASRHFDAGSRGRKGGSSGVSDPLFGDMNEDRRISGTSMNKRGSQSQGRERGSQSQSQSHSQSQTYGKEPQQAAMAPTRPKPKKRTRQPAIDESPPPTKTREKEDVGALVAKWNKVSQQDDSKDSDDDDLGIDFSQGRGKGKGRVGGLQGKAQGQGRKLRLTLSPQSRVKVLPTTTTTTSYNSTTKTNHTSSSSFTKPPKSKTQTWPSSSYPTRATTSDSENDAYLVLSQDMQIIASSIPSKHLLPEVMIGTGDGASLLADSDGERSMPTTAAGESFPLSRINGKNSRAGGASGGGGVGVGKELPRPPARRASIGYSSDGEGGVRDDSFDLVYGGKRQSQSQSKEQSKSGKGKTKPQAKMTAVPMTTMSTTTTTKGKKKSEVYDGPTRSSITATTTNLKSSSKNSKSKSTKLAASSSANATGSGKAKRKGRVIVSASEEEEEEDDVDSEEEGSDDSEPPPALKFHRKGDSEQTPRPLKKRPTETVIKTGSSLMTKQTSKRKDRSPEKRKLATAMTTTTSAGVSGRKRKMAEMKGSDRGLDSSDEEDEDGGRTPVQRRKTAASRNGVSARNSNGGKTRPKTPPPPLPSRKKTTATGTTSTPSPPPPKKKKSSASTTVTKGKEPPPPPPRKIALPEGFPSPMRAPIRPNESLLSSPPADSLGKAAQEKQERPADVGPNGAQMLPVFECVMADAPTLQLPPEKVPQLVARNIVDDKCPYCEEFLPVRMSESASNLFRQLRAADAPHRTGTASSDADWTRTIEFCGRHHAESHVFPVGFHAGYPHEMNFSQLKARVKALKPDVKKMLKRPKNSPFYLFAKRDLENQGRRKWSSMDSANDEKRKDRLLPGYFGPLGQITIGNVLKGMLRTPRFKRLTTPEAIGPLLPEEYVEHVLVIEVALLLISQDTQQQNEDGEPYSDEERRSRAIQILKESREYGRRRFGIGSEHIAEEDWGNGITQMVIADVRGLNDDSEEESEGDQPTSSEPEHEPEPEPEPQQPRHSSPNELDDASGSGIRATRSSPHRIEDDEEDVDMIRPASVSPDILPIDLSPVRSFGPRNNSNSPILAEDSDDGGMLGLTPRPRKDARPQGDNPFYVPDSDDEFDDPAVALDDRSVIEAADEVEETFKQKEKRCNASDAATTAMPKKRAAPKFADVVDVTSSPSRNGPQSHSLRSSARPSTSSTGPPSKRKFNLNGAATVHDLDGDDPMDGNIGRQHHNLMQRTQTRHVSASGYGQRGGRATGSAISSRPGVNGNGYTSTASGSRRSELAMVPSNNNNNSSPYHHNATRRGATRIGLSRNSGLAAASTARAPHSAGSSGAGVQDRSRTGGEARRGGGGGGAASLFHNKAGKHALERRREDQAVWDKKHGR